MVILGQWAVSGPIFPHTIIKWARTCAICMLKGPPWADVFLCFADSVTRRLIFQASGLDPGLDISPNE